MIQKMLCERCLTVMEAGTRYEQNRDGKSSARRYYECKNKKCRHRVYTKEPNFQDYMSKMSDKYRNK